MATDRSIDYLRNHIVVSVVLVAINIVFLVQAIDEKSSLLAAFWGVLAVAMAVHLASLIAGYRRQS